MILCAEVEVKGEIRMARVTSAAPLPEICSIESYQDGALYQWPTTHPARSSRFSEAIYLDRVVIKLPSSLGFYEYEKYIVREEYGRDAIRYNEPIERIQNIDQLLDRYDSLREARTTFGDENVHWLLLQMLQYDRLKDVIKLPATRYCFFSKKKFLFKSVLPGLVQQRIIGISLWDMVDPITGEFVNQEYETLRPCISSQLAPLVTHALSTHINWNIQNFILERTTNILYYIDLKPSSLFGREENEHNLSSIREVFLQE